jgi:DNA sulfur modification protein DndD
MKIKKITLKNFRQFHGEQSIEFSTDQNKNITLIHAENGTGKTALLNAILWCFYSMHTSNFNEQKILLNKVANQEGKKNYYVQIIFIDENDNEYTVSRGYDVSSGENFKIAKFEEGVYKHINNPDSFINSVIPKDMAKYFFFQGEGIGKISDNKGSSVVRTAVEEILGFTIAEHAINDIGSIKKEHQRSLSNADKTGQLSSIQNQIIDIENKIKSCEKVIKSQSENISVYKEKFKLVDEQLANSNSDVVKQIHKARLISESQLSRENGLLIDAQNRKRDLISEFSTVVFGYELSNIALDFIDEQEYKGTVPAPYNEQLVTDILKESRCICGSEIKPGSDAFVRIQEMLKSASDPNLESRIRKARAQLITIKQGFSRAENRFEENMRALAESEQAIERIKDEISNMEAQIKGAESIEKIENIEEERNRLKKNLNESNKQETSFTVHLRNYKSQLEKLKSDLQNLGTFSDEMNKYQQLVDFTEKVESVIKDTLSSAKKDVEIRIIEKVNKYLELFVRQDYTAKLNSTTFDIKLIDKDGHRVPESDGQALLLSLTFIASLIELSRERKGAKGQILTPGAIAPFVVDAPFGDLDNKYKGHVAKAIPDSVEQVAFLLSSSHWSGTVEENIRARVGKEYNMVLEVSTEANEKTDDHISILGEKYETVRYNMPIERTIIEEVGNYV